MRKSLKKALSMGLAAAMIIGLGSGINTQTAEAALDAGQIDSTFYTGQRPYKAYLTFQDSFYNYRDNFDSEKFGVTSTEEQKKHFAADGTDPNYDPIYAPGSDTPGISGFNWKAMFFYRTAVGTEMTKLDFRSLTGQEKTKPDQYDVPKETKVILSTADFESPDISYNGTYSVTMSNFPKDTFQYSKGFRMLCVNTTIPRSVEGVTFSDVKLIIDEGVVVKQGDDDVSLEKIYAIDAKIRNKADSPNTYNLMVVNEYGYDDYGFSSQNKTYLKDEAPDPIWEAAKSNGGVFNMPTESIKITFTVSGLGDADPDYVPQDDNTTAASNSVISATPSALKKGMTQKVGDAKYVVTDASKKTVDYKAPAKKNIKKATIPAKVTLTVDDEEITCKVTGIAQNAFKGCTKLKSVTLGSNVKTIKKNAFKGCKNLANLKVQSKLKKVQKKAFAGCKKTIKVSGKSKKANVKALKKSGYKKFK